MLHQIAHAREVEFGLREIGLGRGTVGLDDRDFLGTLAGGEIAHAGARLGMAGPCHLERETRVVGFQRGHGGAGFYLVAAAHPDRSDATGLDGRDEQ